MAFEIIYCAGGNPTFYEIARAAGFLYGAQLPDTVYGPLHFADQDWEKPNREKYMAELADHRPHLASVLDWEQPEQLTEVLEWAEAAAQFVQEVMIIPKVIGGIAELDKKLGPSRQIGNRPVRLGYSVDTGFSGTPVPAWEFRDWPVHLLGGSPQKQARLYHYFNTVSVDGNMISKMAVGGTRSGIVAVWQPNSRKYRKGHFVPLDEYRATEFNLPPVEQDAPDVAFRYSCENVMAMWRAKLED